VPRHPVAEDRILQAVADFWRDIDAGRIPQPDFSRDGALIRAMHNTTTPGKTVDLRSDNRLPSLLEERERLRERIRAAKDEEERIENEIRDKLSDAEVALVTGWRLTCKEITRKEHVVKETKFRQLRATREEGFGAEADAADTPAAAE